MSKFRKGCVITLSVALAITVIGIGAKPRGKKAEEPPIPETEAQTEQKPAEPKPRLKDLETNGGGAALLGEDIYMSAEEAMENAAEIERRRKEEEEANKPKVTYVMANVQDSVNVRAEADINSEIVGRLYRKCGGEIIEEGEEWTRIKSGELVGWVRNDFLLFGDDAVAFAETNCQKIARVTTECLRIRKGPSTEAETDGLFENGSEWVVKEILEDWICIDYNGKDRYVSAEYVEIEIFIENGETMEEIKAREAIAAMEKAKLTANQGAMAATEEEMILLAALIQAEAGNQPYEGQLAVGAVVCNRVKSARYPNTIRDVIYAPGQFGPASNGSLDAILQRGPNAQCMQAAKEALEGATTVGSATNFHRAGDSEGGIVIGDHVFY